MAEVAGTPAACEDDEEICRIISPARRPRRQTSGSSCCSSSSASCCDGPSFLGAVSTAASAMLPASSSLSLSSVNKDSLASAPHTVSTVPISHDQ